MDEPAAQPRGDFFFREVARRDAVEIERHDGPINMATNRPFDLDEA